MVEQKGYCVPYFVTTLEYGVQNETQYGVQNETQYCVERIKQERRLLMLFI